MASGKVDLSLSIDTDRAAPSVTLTWRESGGPVVGEPKRRSFGSQLIQMGLVGKSGVDASYRPEGLIV